MQNSGTIVIDTTLGNKMEIFCYTGRRVNDRTYWNAGLALKSWGVDGATGWGFINCGYNFETNNTYYANGFRSLSGGGNLDNGIIHLGTASNNYWLRWFAVG